MCNASFDIIDNQHFFSWVSNWLSILGCLLVIIHFYYKENSNMNILHMSFCGLQKNETCIGLKQHE